METAPTVGQRVTLENFDGIYIVKAISAKSATAELITLTGTPCALKSVPISDLSPAESEPNALSG